MKKTGIAIALAGILFLVANPLLAQAAPSAIVMPGNGSAVIVPSAVDGAGESGQDGEGPSDADPGLLIPIDEGDITISDPVLAPEIEGTEDYAPINETQVQEAAPELATDEVDYISGAYPIRITRKLPRFGYSFFRKAPSTFAPVKNIPVSPNYVLGPGDSIRVSLWGIIEGRWTVTVDRNGDLNLPRAGVIGVAGMTFGQVKRAIERAYQRYFTNFELNVTMGQLRSITVYVVGQARQPGGYTVSSMATLINALLASGGPSYSGTLRDIQVKRNGKTITHFDTYALLLKGDKSGDIRLMDGDVIYIPPVGPLAGVTGNVKNPAYYEMKKKIRLSDLVDLAGGFTNRYFKGRVQIERIQDNQYQTAFEGDLVDLRSSKAKNLPLANGDLVKIYPVATQVSSVNLRGAVARPGRYAIQIDRTRLKDILERAGGPLYMASNKAEITRVEVTQSGPKTEKFNIDVPSALRGDPASNVLMHVNDFINIRTVPEWALYRTVAVTGEVKHPGVYTIRPGDTLSVLLEQAGGYTNKAFIAGATLTRPSIRKSQQKEIDRMIDRLEKGLYSASVSATSTAVTESAARMTKMETEQRQQFLDRLRKTKASGRLVVKLTENPRLIKGSPYDLELVQGDRLHIPSRPQSVNVVGSVLNPMAFAYRPQQPFTHYIRQSGGYDINADRRRIYIVRANGTAVRGYRNKKPVTVEDGDSIIVPEKLTVKGSLRDTKDIVDIIYKVAVGAAVVINAGD